MKSVENLGNSELAQKETRYDYEDIKHVQREPLSAEQKREKRLWHLVKADCFAACGEAEPAFTETGKEVPCHSASPDQCCLSKGEAQEPPSQRSKKHR